MLAEEDRDIVSYEGMWHSFLRPRHHNYWLTITSNIIEKKKYILTDEMQDYRI